MLEGERTYIHLMGGLGNTLFQLATSYAYSLRHNKPLEVNDKFYTPSSHKPLSFYKKTIFSKFNFANEIDPRLYKTLRRYTEPSFSFNEIPKTHGSVLLHGYFQNLKYFSDFEEEVKNLFPLKTSSKYDKFLKNSCSVHIRRGDYIQSSFAHPQQSNEYFKKAVETIGAEKTFLIFSDEIKKVKSSMLFENLNINHIIYIEGQDPYEDLSLMSRCENNIISNSSFSWWAAFLNKNSKKTVIHPTKWFTKAYAKQIGSSLPPSNLFPKEWISHE
jgi:hypothetical protein